MPRMPVRRLVLVPHTHWDREWYRTHEAFRYRLVRLMDGLLDALEADPDFRHFTLDGQTIVLDDYLEVRPDARARIERLVRAGRLVVGPWYVLPDEWLVSGEALIRNLRRGLRRAETITGARSEIASDVSGEAVVHTCTRDGLAHHWAGGGGTGASREQTLLRLALLEAAAQQGIPT